MCCGPSCSDRAARSAPLRGGLAGVALGLLLAAALPPGRNTAAQVLPPPPPNGGATRTVAPEPPAPRPVPCPRCGYLCDPGWHYCVACGWDRTRLIGQAEEDRLETIARATVGVTVYGTPNRYGTAFPLGSGLLVTTARNLIASDPEAVKIRTYDNHEYHARIIGYDEPSGLGLLKSDRPPSGELEVAREQPTPPDPSWVVCYPVIRDDDVVHYLPVSLHHGRLTSTGQSGTALVSFENLLQTDHAIEDGCLGSPLIDSRGRVAGLVLGSPEDGITFAAPMTGLPEIAAALSAGEPPSRPFFGVGLVPPDDRRRHKFHLDPAESHPLIPYVIPDSPAARAGVRPGDTLLAIDGSQPSTVWEAGSRLLAAPPAGASVALTLGRDGGRVSVAVAPVKRPRRILLDPIDELQESLQANLEEVPEGSSGPHGLRITDELRGGRGEKAHFKDGDVIVGVDKKSIKTGDTLRDYIHSEYKEIFTEEGPKNRRYSCSYVLRFEVRTADDRKVTRKYVNLFPDFLAPPVY